MLNMIAKGSMGRKTRSTDKSLLQRRQNVGIATLCLYHACNGLPAPCLQVLHAGPRAACWQDAVESLLRSTPLPLALASNTGSDERHAAPACTTHAVSSAHARCLVFTLKQAVEESREHDIMSFFLVKSDALITTGPLETHDRVSRRQLHHTVSK